MTELRHLRLMAEFTVPGEPASKSRARFTNRGGKTHAYTPEKTKQGEERVAWAFRAACKEAPTDPETAYRVEAHFYNGTRQRRDIDNMTKLILDGLNKVAWLDDNQVTEVEVHKSYVPKAEARTEVRIYEAGSLNPPKANCVRCGTEFRTYASWQKSGGKKYCTTKCAYAHRVELRERTCEQCGRTFLAQGKVDDPRCCSKECSYLIRRATVTCDGCGVEFTKQRCHVRAKNYCSTDCQTEAAKKRRSTRFRGTCEQCGGGVTRKEYRRCQACVRSGNQVAGAPKTVTP